MSSVLGVTKTTDSGLAIRYTPCSKEEQTDEDELEEISIIDDKVDGDQSLSNLSKTEDDITDGEFGCHRNHDSQSDKNDIEINGPKQLPGSGLSITASPNDKTKLIGERLSSRSGLPSPVNVNKVLEQKSVRSRATSRQSIFELVRVRANRKSSREDHFNLMKKVRSNETVTSKGIRKQRRREIATRFGKKSIRSDNRFETNTVVSDRDGCNWTFVFDPSGRLSYWWSAVVSIAFIYNFWVIIYRFAFQEISPSNLSVWFTLDYLADFIYCLDIAFHFRTGYLEDGVLQTDSIKLRIHYMNTTKFYIDCLCLLPLDFLYMSIGFCSILRCFRLVKVYRFWTFLDRTERHTNYPNVMRTLSLMHYLLALFHWNACLYYIVAKKLGHSTTWDFPKDNGDVFRQYLHALYWSTLTLTTVGNLPRPRTNGDYVFIIFELLFGLLLFATVLGHISNIVSCVSAARKDFQAKLDNVKTYMLLRRVPLRLQDRVIKWFDYLWMCNKSTDEEKTLSLLPDKLKAEIAIHVHLDTLKRVEIFQQTEAGFLCELVLRLNPVLFSPGDYICRKGEVGKEMYIVNRGRLHVVGDNGKSVLATLKPGSYFGEISILNMGTSGNRRTASVRSVGYSDLFRLSKQDLWDVLKEYPAARVKLESIAVMRLEKTKKKPIDTVDLKRSKSTPGLVESSGKRPMQAMCITRHHTLPAGLPQSSSADHQDTVSLPATSQTPPPTPNVPQTLVSVLKTGGEQQMHETHMRTVSSVTSFLTGSPTVRSPIQTEGPTPMFHFSPPMTPAPQQQYHPPAPPYHHLQHNPNLINICPTAPGAYTDYITRDMSHDYVPRGPAQVSPHQLPYAPYPNQVPVSAMNSINTQQQVAFLSPFCASTVYMPPPSPNTAASRTSSTTAQSQSNMSTSPIAFMRAPSQQSASSTDPKGLQQPHSSPASSGNQFTLVGDSTQESLLQEITRLRERLKTVESENASMSAKLNQQQWELEHRLSELEMHMTCTSDMGSTESTDDRSNPFENISRESII